MEITHMKYFLDVAETQHMTESAERLHIAQPALSQTIHKLERELGVPLFVPKGRNIVLTEYGRYLRRKLAPIVDDIDSIPEELKAMAMIDNDTIQLNVLAASELVTEAVIDYKFNRKNLNFKFMQNAESDVFDIGITTKMLSRSEVGGVKEQFVCSEKIFLAVPRSEKYACVDSVRLKDVADEGFISLAGVRQFRYICDRFCKQADITPRVIFESDNATAVKNMIAANLGVGFWPEFTWGRIDEERVKLLKITEPDCRRDIIVTRNSNKPDDKNVIEFFEFLREFFEQHRTRE